MIENQLIGVHKQIKRLLSVAAQLTLLHSLTRTAYLHNGCLPWYNLVLSHSRQWFNIHLYTHNKP